MAEQTDHDLRQGAKAAAAAAAVAAAAGVARAIATHAHDASRREEEDAEPAERREQVEEPEEREEREERDERAPVQGVSVNRIRAMTDGARSILQELSNVEPESVSAVERTPDGWRVTLEAVELRRVPDSTDLLGTYEVELDDDGELVRYERRRRYSRSQSDDGSSR